MQKHLKDLMTFDGVELVKTEFEIDGVLFQHGNELRYAKPGAHAKYNQQNTVIGHTHMPNITWDQNRHGPFFEMNAGWLGDSRNEAFDYRALKLTSKMIKSFGVVDNGHPCVYIL
jgi:hypothetical protein